MPISEALFNYITVVDINAAVNAISQLFQIDIQLIRYNLLNTWLKSSDMDVDFDTSIVFPMGQTRRESVSDESDPNLKRYVLISFLISLQIFNSLFIYFRAIYLCNSGDPGFWIKFLIKVGLNEEGVENSEQSNNLLKSKALKCLCAITDEETIVRLTKGTFSEFL